MSHESLYSLNLKLLSSNENLYIEKINNGNSKKDSGFDLFVPENIIIPAGKIVLINMKVKCAVSKKVWNNEYQKWKLDVPSPYYLYARSSVSKRGIMLVNSVGVIDSGYRGPLMAAFYNSTDNDVIIPSGDRLVQICMPDLSYDFSVSLVDNLDETERGEGGLGSSGK
jgi:dUTP pyrophosphatase